MARNTMHEPRPSSRFLWFLPYFSLVFTTGLLGLLLISDSFELTKRDSAYTEYYDALGDSILDGRLDVPLSAIRNEALLMNGKYYGYFGPTPALFRIPLNRVVPRMRGHWTRTFMIIECFFTLLATLLIIRQFRQIAWPATNNGASIYLSEGLFVLVAGLATPMTFIMWRPIIYHEAMMTGVCMAMWSFYFTLRFATAGRYRDMVSSVMFAVLSFLGRGSVGCGPLASLVLLNTSMWVTAGRRGVRQNTPQLPDEADKPQSPMWNVFERLAPGPLQRSSKMYMPATILTLLLLTSIGGLLAKNYFSLGNLSGVPSLSRHIRVMNNERRLARTDGGNFFQPVNARTFLANYFRLDGVRIRSRFPYFYPVPHREMIVFPETKMDYSEESVGIPVAYPLWFLTSLFGLLSLLVGHRYGLHSHGPVSLIVIGAAGGALPIFTVACVTHRYLYDLFPIFAICSMMGLHLVFELARRHSSFFLGAIFMLPPLLVYSIYVSFSVTATQLKW